MVTPCPPTLGMKDMKSLTIQISDEAAPYPEYSSDLLACDKPGWGSAIEDYSINLASLYPALETLNYQTYIPRYDGFWSTKILETTAETVECSIVRGRRSIKVNEEYMRCVKSESKKPWGI